MSGRCDFQAEEDKEAEQAVRFLGDANGSLGDAKISLGDAKSSLGDAKSSLGDAKSWVTYRIPLLMMWLRRWAWRAPR